MKPPSPGSPAVAPSRWRGLFLWAFLLFPLAGLNAAVLHWAGGPRDILADTDVSTNGILVRALAKAGRYADILRDPRLDHVIANPDLRKLLQDIHL